MKALDNPVTYYMAVEVGKIKDMHMLACMNTHRHTLRLISLLFSSRALKPRGQVWFTSRSRTGGVSVTQYSNTVEALPQVLSVVVWGHVINVNLVTFLGNEKESGYIKRYVSELSPVQAGLCSLGKPAGLIAATEIKKRAKIKDEEGGNKVSWHGTARRQRYKTVNMAVQFYCNHAVN